jgi:hypothetical protein
MIAPSRIQMGLGGAVPASEPIPMLARLDDSFLKSFQLSWDAINHDWRRNVVGFNFDRQRALWREWKLNVLAPWEITSIVVAIAAVWVGAIFGWLAWRRRRQDRARALWDAMCARLARAGLPRAAYEGPVDYVGRAASRWPEFTSAFAIIGDSYAALRYGPVAARRRSSGRRLWRQARARSASLHPPSCAAHRSPPTRRRLEQRLAVQPPAFEAFSRNFSAPRPGFAGRARAWPISRAAPGVATSAGEPITSLDHSALTLVELGEPQPHQASIAALCSTSSGARRFHRRASPIDTASIDPAHRAGHALVVPQDAAPSRSACPANATSSGVASRPSGCRASRWRGARATFNSLTTCAGQSSATGS